MMAAFQAFFGSYEHRGETYSWSCFATTRFYDVRRSDHGPPPEASPGLTWRTPLQPAYEDPVVCLVDAGAKDFSQIVMQVHARPRAAPGDPGASMTSAAA